MLDSVRLPGLVVISTLAPYQGSFSRLGWCQGWDEETVIRSRGADGNSLEEDSGMRGVWEFTLPSGRQWPFCRVGNGDLTQTCGGSTELGHPGSQSRSECFLWCKWYNVRRLPVLENLHDLWGNQSELLGGTLLLWNIILEPHSNSNSTWSRKLVFSLLFILYCTRWRCSSHYNCAILGLRLSVMK